jgi:hypothetical protein
LGAKSQVSSSKSQGRAKSKIQWFLHVETDGWFILNVEVDFQVRARVCQNYANDFRVMCQQFLKSQKPDPESIVQMDQELIEIRLPNEQATAHSESLGTMSTDA